MLRITVIFVLLGFYAVSAAVAMPAKGCGGDCAGCHSLTLAEARNLMKKTGGEVLKVKLSSVRGLFEVTFRKNGQQGTAYLDFGKKNLIPGPIFNLASMKPIGQQPASQPRSVSKIDISKIPEEDSIVIGNPKGKKRLFVFTDPDCPFCKKLHGELKKLVAKDRSLAVYVKMFPLPMHPQAYDKARVILGEKSPQLLDQAFSGAALPKPGPKDAPKGVDETVRFAETMGISSTPTLIMPDGRVVVGYWDAPTIRKMMADGKR